MTGLSEKTEQIVQKMFPHEQWKEVQELLTKECGNNLPLYEGADAVRLKRIRFAVLRLSKGDLDELYLCVIDAQTDWRDILVASGFGYVSEHLTWADSYLPSGDS